MYYPIFFEDLSTKLYPTTTLHAFGVNGKVSGSVGAIGEMSDNVFAILHAPIGCGFHYRNSARRRHQPFNNLYCTDLTEEEIVYGGEEKLKKTAIELWEKYHPEIIFLIPSPVADILNENVRAVAMELRNEGIPVAGIQSELFSHRDKNYAKNRMKELSKLNIAGDNILEIELKGCGFTEAIYALVDQVMEKQEVVPNSINIETVGWGSEGSIVLREIETLLNKIGITVNCWIPSSKIEKLKTAPKAQLNVVKRIRWAKHMKEIFGTDYMFINDTGRYVGLDGISTFYMDLAKKLGKEAEMKQLVADEEKRVELETKDAKDALSKVSTALICYGFSNAPFMLKTYSVEFGMKVDTLIVQMSDHSKKSDGITKEVEANFMKRIYTAIEMFSPNTKVYVNPEQSVVDELVAKSDFVVGSDNLMFEGKGTPVINSINRIESLSYDSYIRTINRFANRMKTARNKSNLILKRMDFTSISFPRINNKNTTASRFMWETMWLDKSKETN